MKGWRVAVVAWPIDGESRPRGLEGKLEGIGAWIEARGRPASVLVQEVVHGGHDVLVVYGRPADVGAIAEALDGAGSGGLQVLALPTGPMAALCADIGLEGDVGEVLGRVVRLSKMGVGAGRRAPRHVLRRTLRVAASFEAEPRFGFSLGLGRMGDVMEASSRGTRAVLGLARDWAKEAASELLPGGPSSSGGMGRGEGRVAVDHVPFAEALRFTAVSTLSKLPAGLKGFERSVEDSARFHVLWADLNALLSQGAMAMLPGRRAGGTLRRVSASHLAADLDSDFVLDGVRVVASGAWSLGVSPGPVVPLVVV